MPAGSHIRQIGWAAVLAACAALFALLSFQVQTVRSEVSLAERMIIALERDLLMLETEFQTRASQRQLAEWNNVELGYETPRADQYLDSRHQLASLGQSVGPDAPAPIRVAHADIDDVTGDAPAMVSPIDGAPVTLAMAEEESGAGAVFVNAFGDFLIEASPIRAANAQSAAPSGERYTGPRELSAPTRGAILSLGEAGE
ncbi:hypothetical protein [Erythrobacter sp.]|jgi:hypothetical protein|uniref:hypothetical protein n=1 Tax=Erythrobacter sp. TaxID=1042 RepID=UPI002EA21DCC|nr:hypothetical protein [Erythrobacter sp.]